MPTPSRSRISAASTLPSNNLTEPLPTSQPGPASALLYNAVDAAERLRYTLQAYEGLEWLLSFAPEPAAPPPEQVGALVSAINQAASACMDKLDATLAELCAAIPAAALVPANMPAPQPSHG